MVNIRPLPGVLISKELVEGAYVATAFNSSHRFIQGPIQRTMQAWQDFAGELPGGGPPNLSVNFVPAFQGCFLVVQTREQSRGIGSIIPGFLAHPQAEAILNSFCEKLSDMAEAR